MAETYTKLFRSMLLSSIWSQDNATRILWVTLLAEADADGRVYASVPGLASLARLTLEETEAALEKLMSPDPYSKTPDCEGRRVESIDGGFELINHAKYREKMTSDDKKRKAAERAKRYRERKKTENVTPSRVTNVTQCDESRKSLHTEADTDTEADTTITNVIVPTNDRDEPEVEPSWLDMPVRGGKPFSITRSLVGEYSKRYDVEVSFVEQQLRLAVGWVRDNPAKRKTAGGAKRFLTGWLIRAIDSGKAANTSVTRDGVTQQTRRFGQ